jgi:hypothetical protein
MCSSRPPGLSASVRIMRPSSMVSFSDVIFCLQHGCKNSSNRSAHSTGR